MASERTLDPSTLGDHIDRLFRAAWALSGSPVDAEDLVQETFARVLAKPRRVRGEDDLGYLLGRSETFISSRRAAARRPAPETLADRAEPVDPSTASRPSRPSRRGRCSRSIARLAEPFRDALVAVDVVGSAMRRRRSFGTKEADDHLEAVPGARTGG